MLLGLLASLALLLWHARVYWFLTDDSYISFRYARNFAHGLGLVFNPGQERVEGYTNFFWVLILAGLNRFGIAPEIAANPLSLLGTVALLGVVVAFALRRKPEPGREWLVLVPVFGLALTRSVAVWSTSGLETRCFELLIVSGLLRLVVELEAQDAGKETRPIASWLFALGTLTRPDGLLISGCAFATAGAYVWSRHRPALARFVWRQLPFVILVVGHYIFRRIYYGDWLPNTYYAKFGGHYWWSSGLRYLAAFALEYFVLLWIPLLIAGVQHNLKRATPVFPLLVVGVLIPHALYIAAIGGDHFEYRPLDVYFPLAFLLICDGVAWWSSRPVALATRGILAYLVLVALGLTLIPWESHRQFVRGYKPGFPGAELTDMKEAREFLSPERDLLLNLPGLREIARTHRDLTRWMTYRFVAIRQEEHRMFLATAIPDGKALGRLRASGILPRDTYIALDCVGAIPYYSDFRFLDRLGLTDAHVAHSAPVREVMAHSKSATMDYARERGVDLWSIDPVHMLMPLTSTRMIVAIHDGYTLNRPYFAVDAGGEGYLLCQLPLGLEATRARLPGVRIFSFGDSSFTKNFLARCKVAYQDSLAADPFNLRAARNLGYVMLLREDYEEARYHYQVMTRSYPDLLEGFENLSLSDDMLGRRDEALQAARHALQMAQQVGDTAAIHRIYDRFASINAR